MSDAWPLAEFSPIWADKKLLGPPKTQLVQSPASNSLLPFMFPSPVWVSSLRVVFPTPSWLSYEAATCQLCLLYQLIWSWLPACLKQLDWCLVLLDINSCRYYLQMWGEKLAENTCSISPCFDPVQQVWAGMSRPTAVLGTQSCTSRKY